jgi:phage recombination protein Bet
MSNQQRPRTLQTVQQDAGAIVKWEDTHGQTLALEVKDIQTQLCAKATASEAMLFLRVASNLRANPFLQEVFLVKYADNAPAAIVVGMPFFLARAAANPNYDGYEAGILNLEGQPISTIIAVAEGKDANVGGAWCKVYVKGRRVPVLVEVKLSEYLKRRNDGSAQSLWKSNPVTMIEKVAISQAHRRAFPSECVGYTEAEIGDGDVAIDTTTLAESTAPENVIEAEVLPESEPAAQSDSTPPVPTRPQFVAALREEMQRTSAQDGAMVIEYIREFLQDPAAKSLAAVPTEQMPAMLEQLKACEAGELSSLVATMISDRTAKEAVAREAAQEADEKAAMSEAPSPWEDPKEVAG